VSGFEAVQEFGLMFWGYFELANIANIGFITGKV
jgi:hypothetical protein